MTIFHDGLTRSTSRRHAPGIPDRSTLVRIARLACRAPSFPCATRRCPLHEEVAEDTHTQSFSPLCRGAWAIIDKLPYVGFKVMPAHHGIAREVVSSSEELPGGTFWPTVKSMSFAPRTNMTILTTSGSTRLNLHRTRQNSPRTFSVLLILEGPSRACWLVSRTTAHLRFRMILTTMPDCSGN